MDLLDFILMLFSILSIGIQIQNAVAVTSFASSIVPDGTLQPDIENVNDCIYRCSSTEENKCAGIDYDYYNQRCFLHSPDTECGEIVRNDIAVHYRRVPCDDGTTLSPTTPPPEEFPALSSIRTVYPETFIPGGKLIPGLKTLQDCFEYCFKSQTCSGFDFSFITFQCYKHTTKTECNDLKLRAGIMHYRLWHNCNPVYPNTCDNIFLQDLPNNYRRLGGTKIADDIDYGACQNRCKTNPHCQAVDWNISMRTCWQHNTASFPIKGDECCKHARKVCTDDVVYKGYIGPNKYLERRP